MRIRKLEKSRNAVYLGIVCWITYFSIYLGRLNFSASMSEMAQAGIMGKAQLGSVAAAFYLAYGLGQFPSGLLGDRIPAGKLVLTGLLGAAFSNLMFPFIRSVGGMQILWFLNGFSQAMVWPPMARLITDFTSGRRTVNIILAMSFTSPAGMLCAYLLSAVLLDWKGWQYSFWAAAFWILGIALLWFRTVSGFERRNKTAVFPEGKKEKSEVKLKGICCSAAVSGFLWIIGATFIHGVLKDGLLTWIPTYLTERFAIEPSFSVVLTTVLPIINLSGVYLAEYCNKRFFRNEVSTAAVFFVFTFLSMIGMIAGVDKILYGTVVLFAVVTSMMTAVNTLFISLIPIHFQKEGKVATVSGILNAVTYLGSAAASGLFGWIAEQMGWMGTQILWCFCAAMGIICSVTAVRGWKRKRMDIYKDSV